MYIRSIMSYMEVVCHVYYDMKFKCKIKKYYSKYLKVKTMLGGLKTDCFIRIYLIAMNVQLEYFEYRYKKILYRYHDTNIYIDTIDISWQHYHPSLPPTCPPLCNAGLKLMHTFKNRLKRLKIKQGTTSKVNCILFNRLLSPVPKAA